MGQASPPPATSIRNQGSAGHAYQGVVVGDPQASFDWTMWYASAAVKPAHRTRQAAGARADSKTADSRRPRATTRHPQPASPARPAK